MSLCTRVLVGLVWVVGALLLGCGGLSSGENTPGSETDLVFGDIAVDDRTDTIFVLSSNGLLTEPGPSLLAVNPDTSEARTVLDLKNRANAKVYFPESGVLVVSELAGSDAERIDLLDKDTFAPKKSITAAASNWAFALSPGRKHLSGLEVDRSLLIVLDAETLVSRVLQLGGQDPSVAWTHQHDEIVSMTADDPTTAHIRSWQIASGAAGPVVTPRLDLTIDDVMPSSNDRAIAVSPDDRFAVLSVNDAEGGSAILVLDLAKGKAREVRGANGPVGFTPDGSTIVSYGNVDDTSQELLLIDPSSLSVDPVLLPFNSDISYLVSHDGNEVVVVPTNDVGGMALIDASNGKSVTLAGPSTSIGLDEVVSRRGTGELWLVDSSDLFLLDTQQPKLTKIDVSFAPQHINILPNHDKLVLDDPFNHQLLLFDPTTKTVSKTIQLPAYGG